MAWRAKALDLLSRAAYAAGEGLIGAAVRLQGCPRDAHPPPDDEADPPPPDEPTSLGDYELVDGPQTGLRSVDELASLEPEAPLKGSKAARVLEASRRMR